MRPLLTVLAAGAAVVALAGCGEDAPSVPVPPGSEIVRSPLSGWSNDVWTFCDHGHRVYQNDGAGMGGVAVVPGDPSCRSEVDQ